MSLLFGSASTDMPSAKTGLTSSDKSAIKDTWTMFRRETRTNALSLFVALFSRYPEYQKLFPNFADVALKDMMQCPSLTAHALTVTYALASIIESIDDENTMVELIKKNIRNHVRRSVTPEHFVNINNLLIEVMQVKLRSRMTASVIVSWKKFFAMHDAVTRQTYDECRAQSAVEQAAGTSSSGV
ncbi:unnamed protein product [Ixodes persulcatus]